ncbi:MAG: glycosyltransferase family 87 protein [Candidatus Nanopelagicales bacterium]
MTDLQVTPPVAPPPPDPEPATISKADPDPGELAYLAPTLADPLAKAAEPLLGGPLGRYVALGLSWWTPARVAIVVGLVVYYLGFLSKGYCLARGWGAPQRYMFLCYSDIPILYDARGIADGGFPYITAPAAGQDVLEYPVLTGVFMWIAGVVTRAMGGQAREFFAVNVTLLGAFLVWTISATADTVRRRPWDAMLMALAPVVFLASFVNWDLLAVGLTAAALAAWARSRPLLAGLVLGLAVSAKFYPVVIIGPVAVLCVLRRQLPALWSFLLGTAGSYLVVNLPFMLLNFSGWVRFYSFSRTRGQDFGSIWYALSLVGIDVPAESLNNLAMAALLVLCLGIAALAFYAPTPPRLAQLVFLTVAAFVLTNKVYSPQYMLWLLPLAVLARPRWRDLVAWQVFQAAYFVGIWWYLVGYGTTDKGLPTSWYVLAVGCHVFSTVWLAGMVIRDMWVPQLDPVRNDPFRENDDDPGGGVLNRSPSIRPAQRIPA